MGKINWDEWEECTSEEYDKARYEDTMFIRKGKCSSYIFFKRKHKTMFEDEAYKIEISEETITTKEKDGDERTFYFRTDCSWPLILKAVDEWRRRWGTK